MVSHLLAGLGNGGGGDEPVCIRFVNTVSGRLGPEPSEHLSSPEALRRWLAAHEVLANGIDLDHDYHRRALELRDAVYRVFSSIAESRTPNADDIEVLNGELAEALAKIELSDNLAWTLTETNPIERAFMLLALSAADLATSPLSARIRECASKTCGWIFVDHSKNRSRRWCSMSDCGNLEKARRFQERRRRRNDA